MVSTCSNFLGIQELYNQKQNWRYIQYRDGSEELYNHQNDPNEHKNLAGLTEYKEVIEEHKKHIPVYSVLPAGTDVWNGDKYDRILEEWEKEGIPDWLNQGIKINNYCHPTKDLAIKNYSPITPLNPLKMTFVRSNINDYQQGGVFELQ